MAPGGGWNEAAVEAAGVKLHVARAGSGRPLLVLHHDTGSPERLEFCDTLSRRFDVVVPHHPGYGRSDRPLWLRSVRDIAVIYQALLAELGLDRPSLIGLGFGGWIAAEMATMAPTAMIFTPCFQGISHNVNEAIDLKRSLPGANLLLNAAVARANR